MTHTKCSGIFFGFHQNAWPRRLAVPSVYALIQPVMCIVWHVSLQTKIRSSSSIWENPNRKQRDVRNPHNANSDKIEPCKDTRLFFPYSFWGWFTPYKHLTGQTSSVDLWIWFNNLLPFLIFLLTGGNVRFSRLFFFRNLITTFRKVFQALHDTFLWWRLPQLVLNFETLLNTLSSTYKRKLISV